MSTHFANTSDPQTSSPARTAHTTSVGDGPLAALVELTYEVLGIHCEPGENFFDHGDSMAAVQLCTLAERRHGWTITPRDIFAWESFTLLAEVIERDEARRRDTPPAPRQGAG